MSDSEEGDTHRGMARSDSSPAVCSSPTNKNRQATEAIEEVTLGEVAAGVTGVDGSPPANVPAAAADSVGEAVGKPALFAPAADDMAGIPTTGSDGSASDAGDSPHTESLHRSRSVPNLSFGGQQGADIMAALNKEKREGNRGKSSADSSASIKLHHEWTIWFDKSNRKARKGGHTIYEDCIVELGTFSTVQGFWTYWDSLHVHNLKDHCNLRVFKKGIKPLWEDPMNKRGGKWVVRGVPKANRKHLWTTLITHLIAGKLADNSEQTVCGVVLSTRDNGDSMQLWQDGGLTFVGTLETPEQKTERLQRPSTDNMLKELLFRDCDEPYTEFIYQTHYELQHTGANKEKSSYHAARDTLDPSSAAAMAGAALNTVGGAKADSEDAPQSPTALQQQTLMPNMPNMTPEMLQQQQQQQHAQQGQQPQQGQQGQLGMMGSGMIPGMLPGMLPITRVAGMMPMMMGNQQMLFGNVGNYGMMSAGMLPGAQVGNISGFNNVQQSQSSQQSSGQAEGWAKQSDGSDDEGSRPEVQEGTEVSEPVRAIQERAKLIRTVRKKIRYINFFLQRQGKGRELTSAEKQRVKSLPFLQRELQLLEEQQNKEVETQKRLLGVDSLDFLRKPQQPMTYANESEKRFKTMRAIRKKIRFIHYHLERQRQGKVLSPAEIAKVNALPEFEKKLAELEAEEARAVEASQGAFPAGGAGAVPATQSPITPTTPSAVTPTPASLGPAAASTTSATGGGPAPHMPANQQAGAAAAAVGMNRPVHSHGHVMASVPQQQQQHQLQAQNMAAGNVSQHSPPHILELQAQIEAQRRELEEKQKHIEFLIRQQPTAAVMPGGHSVYVSPGPPPLESPGTIAGLNGPMSPVGGLPPQMLQQPGGMTQVLSASHLTQSI